MYCLNERDAQIAGGDIDNDPYTDETIWMLQRGLYSKVDDHPALLADSLMNAFYYNMQNTTVAQFKIVDDDKKQLYQRDSIVNYDLEQKQLNIQQLKDSLKVQTNILAAMIDSGGNTGVIDTAIAITQDSIAKLAVGRDSVLLLEDSLRAGSAESSRTYNDALATNEVIENNERLVNNIYLETIARDLFEFNSSQLTTLYAIAHQCPLAGGTAVFRARALYALVDEGIHYDDRNICKMVGISLKQAAQQPKNQLISLFPNPANETVTLEYAIEKNTVGEFIITNTLGQIVYFYNLPSSNSSFVFSVKDYPPALYHYKVLNKSALMGNGKLVIIH